MSWLHEQNDEGPRRGRRTLVVAAAVVLAGVAVAGCSDDDEAATTVDTEATTETNGTAVTEDTAANDQGGSAQEQVTVDIVSIEDAFEPSSATVAAGGEVTWVNTDDIAHTTTAEDGTWDSGTLEAGAEFTFSPDEAGTYPYFCSIHPSMTGELIVE
jgi:plastocyanin